MYRYDSRDETEFPVGFIVDQSDTNLFGNIFFRELIAISPNSNWALLFRHSPNFMVLLNLETNQSYNIGLYESPTSFWTGPQSLIWTHEGINNIRESVAFGFSAERFSTKCEHTAGGAYTHPIKFVKKEDFPSFAATNEEMLAPGKNQDLWLGTFESIELGGQMIQQNKPWTAISKLSDDFVEITPRGKVQTFICELQDLQKHFGHHGF